VVVSVIGIFISYVDDDEESLLYEFKKFVSKLMRVVFSVVIILGLYINLEQKENLYRIAYDNNVSIEHFELNQQKDAKSYYSKFEIDDFKKTRKMK